MKKRMESEFMLSKEICELREKLNKSIEAGEEYATIYKISVQLDKLIATHYKKTVKC